LLRVSGNPLKLSLGKESIIVPEGLRLKKITLINKKVNYKDANITELIFHCLILKKAGTGRLKIIEKNSICISIQCGLCDVPATVIVSKCTCVKTT